MSLSVRSYIVNNIKLPINASLQEAFSVAAKRLKKINIDTFNADFRIYKKSIDARNKNQILFVYSVIATGDFPILSSDILAQNSITLLDNTENFIPSCGNTEMYDRPLVVGTGPAGLFAALILAEAGYCPVLLERGNSISERKKTVKLFRESGILDTDSNIQFGAGGAGTFSDGKLITRVNDPHSAYVMQRFVDFGAPEEILYLARPHIGTDILSQVVDKMLEHIISLGATVYYNTKYETSYKKDGISYAKTSKGAIPYGALILAIGHSARDTYNSLIEANYTLEAKSFSVGMRIEHLAEDIDRAMYGKFAGDPLLGHAEYNLAYNTKQRGVYTFCMCPGGEVVAAASESSGVVVNGMSEHARAGKNSNSAVLASIFKEDYGATPTAAIEFQRKIERAAFIAGGSNYSAPIITVGDFLNDRLINEPKRILPSYREGRFTKLALPDAYLPKLAIASIKNALIDFDRKIKGFAVSDAVLTGAETRTSAPVRILRNNDTRLALGAENVYPCGEGAGYAGGITSAAIDGIKTAISIIKRYKPHVSE